MRVVRGALVALALLGCGGARPSTRGPLWRDPAPHRPRVVLQRGHTDRVTGSAWLGDDVLVTTGSDSTLRVWDAATGAVRGSRPLSETTSDDFASLRVSPDGRLVASWSDWESIVHLWNLESDTYQRVDVGHGHEVDGEWTRSNPVLDLEFGPRPGEITVATEGGLVVWNSDRHGTVMSTLQRRDLGRCVDIDRRAEHAFCASGSGAPVVFDLVHGRTVVLPVGPIRPRAVELSPSGHLLAVRAEESRWSILRTSDGARVGVIDAESEQVAFVRGETRVLVSTSAKIQSWTVGGELEREVPHPYPDELAPSPSLFACASGARFQTHYHWDDDAVGEVQRVIVWDADTLTPISDVAGASGLATLSSTGTRMHWGAQAGTPMLWDTTSGTRLSTQPSNLAFDTARLVGGVPVVSHRRAGEGEECMTYALSPTGAVRAAIPACGHLADAGGRLLVYGAPPISSSPLLEYLMDPEGRPVERWDLHPQGSSGAARIWRSPRPAFGNWMSTDRSTFVVAYDRATPTLVVYDVGTWEPIRELSVPGMPIEVDASRGATAFAVRIGADVGLSSDGTSWTWLRGVVREEALDGIALVGSPPLLVIDRGTEGLEARDMTGALVAHLTGVTALDLVGHPSRPQVAFLSPSAVGGAPRPLCVWTWELDDERLPVSSAGYDVRSRDPWRYDPSEILPVAWSCGSDFGRGGYYGVRYSETGDFVLATTIGHRVELLFSEGLEGPGGYGVRGDSRIADASYSQQDGVLVAVDGTLQLMRVTEDGDATTLRMLLTESDAPRSRGGSRYALSMVDDGRFSGDERVHDAIWVRLGTDVARAPMVRASDLYYSFYTPDLNERFLGGGIGDPPRELARGVSLPPRIAWDGEPTPAGRRITVRARLEGAGPNVEAGVLVDGAPVPSRISTDGDSGRVEADLWLAPGEHEVEAFAFSEVGHVRGRTPPLRLTGRASSRASVLRALVVTVDRYRDPTLRLEHRRDDGDAITRVLRSLTGRGYDSVEVTALGDSEATRDALLRTIAGLTARTTPSDTLVVYFAAHGMLARCGEEEEEEFRVLLHGVSRDASTRCTESIAAREIEARLFTPSPATHELLILDACDAGGATTGRVRQGRALRNLGYLGGFPVIAASRAGTIAHEYDSLGHGALTFAILEAFEGAGGGELSVWELQDAVLARVPEISSAHDAAALQVPVVSRGRVDYPLAVRTPPVRDL